MLTARGEDIDRILGLELGADDYLPKPFNPRELVARLRAIMRRQTSAARQPCSSEFSCRSLRLLPGARRAEVHGSALSLTSTEFTILEMLISAAGTVVDKNTLSEGALGRPLTAYDRSLDMHISHLRRKLAQQDPDLVIHTVRGLGYQLENP
jgi:DNA-binding response OmpR family regulator